MKPTGATKEATDHSPLPWRVRDEDGTLGSVVDAEENMVAQTQQQLADPRHHKRRANAQLIVTAVNERERLREALRLILKEAEFVGDAKQPFSTWVAENCRAALNDAPARAVGEG